MHVCMISFGANWWAAHSANINDPYRYRRNAAWFNSAGLKYGRRLRLCWVLPGQIRFNQSSGFNPEFPMRAVGRIFDCDEPRVHSGRVHLLVTRRLKDCLPDAYLVTLTDRAHGEINLKDPGWRSPGVRPISVSLRPPRYEAIVLMGPNDWVRSDLGKWRLASERCNLTLAMGDEGDAA